MHLCLRHCRVHFKMSIYDDENLDKILDQLTAVQAKLTMCVEDIPRAMLDPAVDRDIDRIRVGFRTLSEKLQLLFRVLIDTRNENVAKIIELKTRCGEIMTKLQVEEKKFNEASGEVKNLENLTVQQSKFCSNLGSVLGNLLWQSSKFPQLVNNWLIDQNTSQVGEFLSIASTTLTSFVDTFTAEFPPIKDNECQFIMAILGIATNISSAPVGRQYLVSHVNGKNFITELIRVLPSMMMRRQRPSDAATNAMTKLMLMILYNVSLNREGLFFILNLKIDQAAASIFHDSSVSLDLQLSALFIFQSLTYNMTDFDLYKRLQKSMPIDKIQYLAASMCNEEISKVAQEILINFKNCEDNADTVSLHTNSSLPSLPSTSENK